MSVTQPTHSYDFRVASTTSVSDQMGSGGTATYQGSAVSTTADGVVPVSYTHLRAHET